MIPFTRSTGASLAHSSIPMVSKTVSASKIHPQAVPLTAVQISTPALMFRQAQCSRLASRRGYANALRWQAVASG